jgi:RNA recognition motif-containing protein
MKKLIFLLSLVAYLGFNSCAEERPGSKDYVKRQLNRSADANTKITNTNNLYYTYFSRNFDYELNCSEISNFFQLYGINLLAIDSLYNSVGGFYCKGNLAELIIAVEVNNLGTGGNLFLYFRPNLDEDLKRDPGLGEINFIASGQSRYISNVLLVIDFTINNQGQNFNGFNSFDGHLYNNLGVISMNSKGNLNYDLFVNTNGGLLIEQMELWHSR